jgi:hypothetical protein
MRSSRRTVSRPSRARSAERRALPEAGRDLASELDGELASPRRQQCRAGLPGHITAPKGGVLWSCQGCRQGPGANNDSSPTKTWWHGSEQVERLLGRAPTSPAPVVKVCRAKFGGHWRGTWGLEDGRARRARAGAALPAHRSDSSARGQYPCSARARAGTSATTRRHPDGVAGASAGRRPELLAMARRQWPRPYGARRGRAATLRYVVEIVPRQRRRYLLGSLKRIGSPDVETASPP